MTEALAEEVDRARGELRAELASAPLGELVDRVREEIALRGWEGAIPAGDAAAVLAAIEAVREDLVRRDAADRLPRTDPRSRMAAYDSIGGLGDVADALKRRGAGPPPGAKPPGDVWAPPDVLR